MASWTSWVFPVSLLVTLLLLWVVEGEGSVTWRRINKPSLRTTTPASVSTTSPTKKSSVTWRRSTITRRSTVAVEHRHEQEEKKIIESPEDSSDDIEEASSVQEEHITKEKLENESEVKPLTPGSRPGFWFDSRRKKPSSLLKPGVRNSLFPTRSSSTTEAPTPEAVTPLTVIPRTVPSISATTSKGTSNRQFDFNRSTRPPITFRKRLKTTKDPKLQVPEAFDSNKKDPSSNLKDTEDKETSANRNKEEKSEKDNLDEDSIVKRPLGRLRKRPYNGTRLSWMRKNGRTTTTAAPTQETTTKKASTVQESELFSRKTTSLSKVRSRTRTTPTTKQTSNSFHEGKVDVSTKSPRLKESFGKKHFIETDNEEANKSSARKHYRPSDDYVDDNFEAEIVGNNKEINEDEPPESTLPSTKQRTTVEPFYITREYGRVATVATETKRSQNPGVKADLEMKKKKKRIRPKVPSTQATEAPTTTTTREKDSYSEIEYDNDNDAKDTDFSNDIEEFGDYSSDLPSINRTTPLQFEKYEEVKDDITTARISITPSPVTLPALSTIGLDGGAYVVWSLGQGGSGWSYQKHGGDVKWSAQNSGAEGDRWSVVGKDEAANIATDYNQQWSPERNVTSERKSEKIELEDNGRQTHSTKTKISTDMNPLTSSNASGYYFRNNTELDSEVNLDSALSKVESNSSDPTFPPSTMYSMSVSVGGIKYLDSTNRNVASDHVNGAYISELQDAHESLPEAPPTSLIQFQEHETEGPDEPVKQSPHVISDNEHIDQFQLTNPYPTTETLPAYFDTEFNDPTFTDQAYSSVPAISNPLPEYFSNIPPELAKAVVEDKKWHVVGVGGDDGWSLLNEDGVLEWKIHNVDGKWKVTSAEQLAKLMSPVENAYGDDVQVQEEPDVKVQVEPGVQVQGYDVSSKQNPVKVWTFDDDLAKWRAVSSERGLETSFEEKPTSSSEEYDYGSQDYDSFSSTDDYSTYPPTENYNQDYVSRPAYTEIEDKSLQNTQSGERYLLGNIEIANSKEDAIESWKALLAQEGHWKLSGNAAPKSEPRQDYHQNLNKNLERLKSTLPPEIDNAKKKQFRQFNEADERLVTGKMKANDNQPSISSRIQQFPGNRSNHQRLNSKSSHSFRSKGETENVQPAYYSQDLYGIKGTYRGNDGSLSTASHIRIWHKDHSKLDSLIEKLEHIQTQAKGRAVVDLAKLLRHIKGQINDTSQGFSSEKSNSQHQMIGKIPSSSEIESFIDANNQVPLREQHNPQLSTVKSHQTPNEFLFSSHHHAKPKNGNKPQNVRTSNYAPDYPKPKRRPNGRKNYQSERDRESSSETYSINPQVRTQPPHGIDIYNHAQAIGEHLIPEYKMHNQQNQLVYLTESSQQKLNNPSKHFGEQDAYISTFSEKMPEITQEHPHNIIDRRHEIVNKQQKPEASYATHDNNYRMREQQALTRRQNDNIHGLTKGLYALEQNYRPIESSHKHKMNDNLSGFTNGQEPEHRPSENQREAITKQQESRQKHKMNDNLFEFTNGQEPEHRPSENQREAITKQQESNYKYKMNLFEFTNGQESEQRPSENQREPVKNPQIQIQKQKMHGNHYERTGEPQERRYIPHEYIYELREQQVAKQKHPPTHDHMQNKDNLIKEHESTHRQRTSSSLQELTKGQKQKQTHRPSENRYKQVREQQKPIQKQMSDGNRYGGTQEPKQRFRTTGNVHELKREQGEPKLEQRIKNIQYEPKQRYIPSESTSEVISEHKHRHPGNKYELSNIRGHQQDYNDPEGLPVSSKIVDRRDSGDVFVNVSDIDERRGHKRKQRHRNPTRRPKQSTAIVLRGETEVEDEKSGSVRNRKIIVIDYAGTEKQQSSVDKKELELIIRNVRHQRSGLSEKE